MRKRPRIASLSILSSTLLLCAQQGSAPQPQTALILLSFGPQRAEKADEYHGIKVLIDGPGLTARTNTGYYNEPWKEGVASSLCLLQRQV